MTVQMIGMVVASSIVERRMLGPTTKVDCKVCADVDGDEQSFVLVEDRWW